MYSLLLLPQRYEFSSKSQLLQTVSCTRTRCCCYRKGTNFQANHNIYKPSTSRLSVVVATAKVRIFKQITTSIMFVRIKCELLLLPQRYEFSSKSQQYPKKDESDNVVVATAKVRIFKQITTYLMVLTLVFWLLLLPQRYEFSSKSQPF